VFANVIESFIAQDISKQTQDIDEPTSAEEKTNIGNAIFTLDIILNND